MGEVTHLFFLGSGSLVLGVGRLDKFVSDDGVVVRSMCNFRVALSSCPPSGPAYSSAMRASIVGPHMICQVYCISCPLGAFLWLRDVIFCPRMVFGLWLFVFCWGRRLVFRRRWFVFGIFTHSIYRHLWQLLRRWPTSSVRL